MFAKKYVDNANDVETPAYAREEAVRTAFAPVIVVLRDARSMCVD